MHIFAAARPARIRSPSPPLRASCARASWRHCRPGGRRSSRRRTSAASRTCKAAPRRRCGIGSNSSTYNEVMSKTVHVACPHDCPDTCAMLVTVEDGIATKIQGDPTMPFTDGTLCTKVSHYLERTYSPDRLLYPMKRTGKKGEGKFRRVGWDEALDEIAGRLKV